MSVLPVLLFPDPRLRQACAGVAAFDTALRLLTDDMFDTMYAAKGRGLAAPQVGVMLRLFVMDIGWKDGTPTPLICVNPRIVPDGRAMAVNIEVCLSIPDRSTRIARPATVRMTWHDHAERNCANIFDGFAAVCVQHECDHLDGVLCIDHPVAAA